MSGTEGKGSGRRDGPVQGREIHDGMGSGDVDAEATTPTGRREWEQMTHGGNSGKDGTEGVDPSQNRGQDPQGECRYLPESPDGGPLGLTGPRSRQDLVTSPRPLFDTLEIRESHPGSSGVSYPWSGRD